MTAPSAYPVDTVTGGHWQVFVYPDGARVAASMDMDALDITFFRDMPTKVVSKASADPFGPTTAVLSFPKITVFDKKGQGDLWWCVPEADVDICWVVDGAVADRWQGFFASFEYGTDVAGSTLTITCQGAMFQLDHFLAKPEYLYAPITFESAILRQFYERPSLRLGPPKITWPSWWSKTYTPDEALIARPWLIPTDMRTGQKWSGMLTRYTGQFEQSLTGYVQQLLSSMHTERGQFTLLLDDGRIPVLKHRDWVKRANVETLVVDLLWPGVSLSSLSEDHSQKMTTVYSRGKTLAGVTYSGMQVSNDGRRTTYEPYASRRDVHPQEDNSALDTTMMRREVQLQAADGMTEADARLQARMHLQRFADPGVTGSLTLSVDPLRNGVLFPRQMITAGMHVLVRNLFGSPDGMLMHITDASMSEDMTVSLTLDSKFRDQLTVEEVRLRGRDALTPTRMLTTGAWQPEVQDILFPWSYERGAGFIPMGSEALFRDASDELTFPWESWTTTHPPKDPQWRDFYIRIGPKSSNASDNWSCPVIPEGEDAKVAHPVLMSAAGSSKLIQVAAFDEDGNVLPVGFHFSIWAATAVSPSSTPSLIDEYDGMNGYEAGQYYPFWPGAWESMDANGQLWNVTAQAEPSSGLIIAWGNYYEKAGYWPSASSVTGATPTGLFVDESSFSWDLTQGDVAYVNAYEPASINSADVTRASLYVLVYCDEQLTEEVFFLGRIFRAEPGTT